jgi:hypothetical protein
MNTQSSQPRAHSNHKLRRYRELATRSWAKAKATSQDVAREMWAAHASFWQEMAARREDFLARLRANTPPGNH